MSISEFQFQQMLARCEAGKRKASPVLKAPDAVEQESDLHDQIINLCRARGWAFIHSRMDRATTCGVGIHDFTIYADGGRVFNFECKDRDGKLSLSQQAWIAQLKHNGHTVHVVRSIEEVLDIIFQPKLPSVLEEKTARPET